MAAQRRNAVFQFMGTRLLVTRSFSSPEPPVSVSRRGLRRRESRQTGPRAQPPVARRARRLWGQEWFPPRLALKLLLAEAGEGGGGGGINVKKLKLKIIS